MFFKKVKVCTHDGKFHADDVFSVATLDLFFDGKIKVTRSRDQKIIDDSDIVVDNGREYSVEKKIFDHHQKDGAGERENGIPYAGFGLIWKHYGKELCERMGADETVWQEIDKNFVAQIDASDTGYSNFFDEKIKMPVFAPDNATSIFIPTWKEKFSDADSNFKKCAKVAKEILKRLIKINKDKIEGRRIVDEIYKKTPDKRVIVLDRYYPFSHLANYPEPIFVVYPDTTTTRFKIQGIPKIKDSYELRMKFNDEWNGLSGLDLEKASGIQGMSFCHNSGFLCGVKDLNTAKQVLTKMGL